MTYFSETANAREGSSFVEVVRFCAIGLLLSLAFVIIVRCSFGEWS
jgi:hypothetical protein